MRTRVVLMKMKETIHVLMPGFQLFLRIAAIHLLFFSFSFRQSVKR
uniref:Uncharacterized protein n=1 Tax=Anguilla anguilla TaxID=7936 RepID=A0A0E9UGY1_ANGAN